MRLHFTLAKHRIYCVVPEKIHTHPMEGHWKFLWGGGSYCPNPKTVNTRIISGMLLCCEEKANQMQDEKTQAVTVMACSRGLRFLTSYPMVIAQLKCQSQIKVFTVFGFAQ